MSITPFLSQDIPVFGYRIPIAQTLTSVLMLSVIAIYLVNKRCFRSKQNTPLLSETAFWSKVESFPTVTNESDPITIGNKNFSNLAAAQKKIALSYTKTSKYVETYLIKSSFKGSVLDLNCGIGANAIPLVAKMCTVTVIDREKMIFSDYRTNEVRLFIRNVGNRITRGMKQTHHIVGDITEVTYPENIDAVICVNTLPLKLMIVSLRQ
jgi:hypothetical protein